MRSSVFAWWEHALVDTACGIIVTGALVLLFAFLTAHGQPTFTRDQQRGVQLLFPGGNFIGDDRIYEWCDGATWIHINPHLDREGTGRGCVRLDVP
jgi:hypothetical protein